MCDEQTIHNLAIVSQIFILKDQKFEDGACPAYDKRFTIKRFLHCFSE